MGPLLQFGHRLVQVRPGRFLTNLLSLTGLALAAAVISCTGPGDLSSISVTPNSLALLVGQLSQLQVVVTDPSGLVVTNPPLSWSSSHPAVASVDTQGQVVAQRIGEATVTAVSGTLQQDVSVSVTAAPPQGQRSPTIVSFFGGSAEEQIRDIAIDAQGNVIIVGNTRSLDFPATAGAYQTTRGTGGSRDSDAFVAKFSSTGQLLWASYLGGPNFERAYAVEVDAQGNVILAGRAGAGFPVTAGAFQTNFRGSPPSAAYDTQDGFVCKLSADGATLIFCSYFGTEDGEIVRDVAVDALGDIYLAAGAAFGTFPSGWLSGAYQPARAGGVDIIVAKVASDGSQILWASYVGGSADEAGGGPSVRVTSANEPVLLFGTLSPGIATAGGWDGSWNGGWDLFVAKLSADGTGLQFGSYLGGSGDEDTETHGLALDPTGDIYVAATTSSTDFPTTAGAYQTSFGGGRGDAFVSRLAADGSNLVASTYLGGSQSDGVEGVALGPTGTVVTAGGTNSPDFPVTSGSEAGGGGRDLLALELSSDLSQLLYSRRVGGTQNDSGRAAAVDGLDVIWIMGMTESSDFPVVAPIQGGYAGGVDGAITQHRRGP